MKSASICQVLLSVCLVLAVAAASGTRGGVALPSRVLQLKDDDYVAPPTVSNGDLEDDGFEPTSDFSGLPKGTKVSYWDAGVWVDGTVLGLQNGKYVVQWDDYYETVEYFDSHFSGDRLMLQKMAQYAKRTNDDPPADFVDSEDLWPDGTPIAAKEGEDGSVKYGHITGYRNGEYKISYSDGSSFYMDDFDAVFDMVLNAQDPARMFPSGGINAVGITFLVLGAVAIVLLGCCHFFFACLNCNSKKTPAAAAPPSPKSEFDIDNGLDLPSNKDRPDELPTIT